MTRQCLKTLKETIGTEDYEMILIDNGSQDNWDAMRLLGEEALPNRSIVHRFQTNEPIAACWNFAFHLSTGDKVLLLNNDLIFNKTGWLEQILQPLDRSEVGAVGSTKMSWNNVEFLEGAVLAFNRDIAKSIVGDAGTIFDDGFEFTCEEMDFCYRLTQAGKELVSCPVELLGLISHLHHGTISYMFLEGVDMLNVMHKSRLYFCRKWGLPDRVND